MDYGVYNHPIGNCLRVYVGMRTLYVISCTTQWGLYLGMCLTLLMDIISRDLCKCLTLKLLACFDLLSPSLPIHNANKILCKRKFHRINCKELIS
jgi:hypothetical protein